MNKILQSILDEYKRLNLKSATMYISIDVLMVRNQLSKGDAGESPEDAPLGYSCLTCSAGSRPISWRWRILSGR